MKLINFRDGMNINFPIRYSRIELEKLIRTPGLVSYYMRNLIAGCLIDGIVAGYLIGIGNGFRKTSHVQFHRNDGPALIFANGKLVWYLYGRLDYYAT
jgi:hypothetical protein